MASVLCLEIRLPKSNEHKNTDHDRASVGYVSVGGDHHQYKDDMHRIETALVMTHLLRFSQEALVVVPRHNLRAWASTVVRGSLIVPSPRTNANAKQDLSYPPPPPPIPPHRSLLPSRTWGFQSLSYRMHVSALCRLMPKPPALVESRKTNFSEPYKKQRRHIQ